MTQKEFMDTREAAAEPYADTMRSTISRVCLSLLRSGIEKRHAGALEVQTHAHGAYQLIQAVVTEGEPIQAKLHDMSPLEEDDLDVYQWEREVLDDAISTCKEFINEWRDKEMSHEHSQ